MFINWKNKINTEEVEQKEKIVNDDITFILILSYIGNILIRFFISFFIWIFSFIFEIIYAFIIKIFHLRVSVFSFVIIFHTIKTIQNCINRQYRNFYNSSCKPMNIYENMIVLGFCSTLTRIKAFILAFIANIVNPFQIITILLIALIIIK